MLLLATVRLAAADQDKQLAEKLKTELVGHVLIIRNFYTASKLSFDASGKLVGDGGKPDWMRAQLDPTEVKINGNEVTIHGTRVKTEFHGDDGGFINYPEKEDVTVRLQLPSAPANEDEFRAAFARAFLTGDDRLEDLVPAEWKARLHASCPFDPKSVPSLQESHATPPAATYSPDPEYTDDARSHHIQGMVKLAGVIDVDGKMKCLKVVESLGHGLDEQSLLTIRKWIFKPAIRNDQPLPIKLNVEVNFRLYSQR
jgi:TonB family protein